MSRSQATQSAAASALQVKIKPPPVVREPPPPHRHRAGSTIDGLTDSRLKTVPTTKKTETVPTKRAKLNNGQSQSRPHYKSGQNGSHFEPKPVPPPLPNKCDQEIEPGELDFSNTNLFGKGSFGEIVKACWGGTPVAAKSRK
ncbi:hypothetical protein CASFOL_039808 [Castilleja foliolosa]|uniref:Uncharacterized protein n=1 Tax=Castilleja foliolosa TaxID=1961234 RepID=A0ABD3BG84_9LAMI